MDLRPPTCLHLWSTEARKGCMQVGLNTQAMVATSLLHASILRSGKLYVDEAAEAEYMRHCLNFVTKFQVGMDPPAPRRTFAQHWDTRCDRDWRWAFQLFSLGASLRTPPPPQRRCRYPCRRDDVIMQPTHSLTLLWM